MRLLKLAILFLVLSSIMICLQCCNSMGPDDWNWNKGYTGENSDTWVCRKFFAMYGDFKAQEIANEQDASEFCRKTAWKYFTGHIEYNESGPDSGYAYMIECCND